MSLCSVGDNFLKGSAAFKKKNKNLANYQKRIGEKKMSFQFNPIEADYIQLL